VVDAATAQSTATAAATDAATAQVTADTAELDAAAAQTTADTAELDAAAAQSTADTAATDAATAESTANAASTDAAAAQFTADTALADAGEAQSTADAAAAGHTVNTNTQLTNAQVAAAATAQGFVTGAHTTDSNTQLDEAAVDGFVANNGFGLAADVSANTAAIASLGGAVTGLEACADGLTVADHDTGLLWEKKTGTPVDFASRVLCETAGCPDPHDVANAYKWSIAFPDPNGGAFTDFLAKLNDSSQPATWSSPGFLNSPSVGTQTTGCFADHCDWRLPNIVELQTILDCSFGAPCIDPLFGPTASSFYWSASNLAINPNNVWFAIFDSGIASPNATGGNVFFSRAVRAGSCN
jgi:hypothetical protein